MCVKNMPEGDTMWEMPPIFNSHPTHNPLSDPLGINQNGPGSLNGPPHHMQHHLQVQQQPVQHHNPHLMIHHSPHVQQQQLQLQQQPGQVSLTKIMRYVNTLNSHLILTCSINTY